MRRVARTHPIAFATATTVLFGCVLAGWPLLAPPGDLRVSSPGWALWGLNATRLLVPVVLLTALGWWTVAGFGRRLTWPTLWPFLPLMLLIVLNLLSGSGTWQSDPRTLAVTTLTMLAVGFGEEAVFRGVVLRALERIGRNRAAMLSALLFGAFHVVNVALGAGPVDVGFQVLYTALLGYAFAATALVTGAIWPLVAIHTLMDLAYQVQAGTSVAASAASSTIDLTDRLLAAIPNLALAAYGYWLIRRNERCEHSVGS